MSKPTVTLFLIQSLDGKISCGNSDTLDVDKHWRLIDGVKEGLHQYYEIEQTTDLCSLNTGRVMAKIGVNERTNPTPCPCTFVIVDNKPHLTASGVRYLYGWASKLLIVTTNSKHPAFDVAESNLQVMFYHELDLPLLLEDLKEQGIDSVTVQSGGSLNELFLRNNLIDFVHIVVAPLLVGGKDTPTLIDGESITTPEEFHKLKALKLLQCNVLENSFVELKYQVVK